MPDQSERERFNDNQQMGEEYREGETLQGLLREFLAVCEQRGIVGRVSQEFAPPVLQITLPNDSRYELYFREPQAREPTTVGRCIDQ